MRHFSTVCLLLLFSVISLGAATGAETMRDARDGILERLSKMDNLWNRGLTGESNEGFIVARSSLNRTQISLIQEENRDRAILYSYVAERTGTDMFSVGRERAVQIHRMAKNGLWIQDDQGKWARK